MIVLPPVPEAPKDPDALSESTEVTVETEGVTVPVNVTTPPSALDLELEPNDPVTTGLADTAPVCGVEVVAAAPNPGRKLGEYVAVPAYCGQPGTVVLGGARPPPQSRKSQSSPVPGT